jgi:hypothetical protein
LRYGSSPKKNNIYFPTQITENNYLISRRPKRLKKMRRPKKRRKEGEGGKKGIEDAGERWKGGGRRKEGRRRKGKGGEWQGGKVRKEESGEGRDV